jgi:hypothetical protein
MLYNPYMRYTVAGPVDVEKAEEKHGKAER